MPAGRNLPTKTGRRILKVTGSISSHSLAWLYQQEPIRKRIEQLREERLAPQITRKAQARASDASKDSIISALRQRVKEMEAENPELKKQLEIVYGELEKAGRHR
jgi:hypothetical protein